MVRNIRTAMCMIISAGITGAYTNAHDVILEFKGANFLPTHHTFSQIYHSGGAIWGPELTARLYKNIYGFISTDMLTREGKIALGNPTRMTAVNVGLGLKYLMPFEYGSFYVGAGVLPGHLHVTDESARTAEIQNKGFCGGVAKVGTYFNLPHSFVLDVFLNFSFGTATLECNALCSSSTASDISNALSAVLPRDSSVVPKEINLNGCVFGIGLGYRWGFSTEEAEQELKAYSDRAKSYLTAPVNWGQGS